MVFRFLWGGALIIILMSAASLCWCALGLGKNREENFILFYCFFFIVFIIIIFPNYL